MSGEGEILTDFEDIDDEVFVVNGTSPDHVRNVSQYACLNSKRSGAGAGAGEGQSSYRESMWSHGTADGHGALPKRSKVVWTKELHHKFLEAIKKLGVDSKIDMILNN